MTTRVYNRGKPNKKFACLKIEQTNIDKLKFNTLFTSITNQSEFNSIVITDQKAKDQITNIGSSNILVGIRAGTFLQGTNAIALGTEAGTSNQGASSISIGYTAGNKSQQTDSIAIGYASGFSNQGSNSISIGLNSAYKFQSNDAISVGTYAGYTNQNSNCIAIGKEAGNICQGTGSISIGPFSGSNLQGEYCIAIGTNAGKDTQNRNSIAIGSNVGLSSLGEKSIVIGNNIICTQDNSLVINTSDEVVTASTGGLFIGGALIERNTGGDFRDLVYNPDTKQVVYQPQTAQSIQAFIIDNGYITCKKGPATPEPGPETTVDIGYDASTTGIIYEIFSVTGGGNKQTLRLFQADPTSSTLSIISDNNDATSNFTVTISAIDTVNKLITLNFAPIYTGTTATPFITVTRFCIDTKFI